MTDHISLKLGDREVHWDLSREQAAVLAQTLVQVLGPAQEGLGED